MKINTNNYHNGRTRYFHYNPGLRNVLKVLMLCVLRKGDAFIEKGATWGAAGSTRAPPLSRPRHRECGEVA